MPHRCIECKNVLESGELDLDKGCPVCGGKKFQYIRVKREPRDKDLRKLTVAEYVAHAAEAEAKAEKPQARKEAPKPKAPEPEAKPKPDVKEKKPEAKDKKPGAERIESVRILEKGSYDLNLPVLLNRKELVMSKEEGVYVVDLPSALKAAPPKKKKRWQKNKK
jgi:uncharacterized protein